MRKRPHRSSKTRKQNQLTSAAAGSPENGRRKNAKLEVDPKRNPERRGKYEKSTFIRTIGPETQEKTELYLNSTSPDSRRKSLARRKPVGTRRWNQVEEKEKEMLKLLMKLEEQRRQHEKENLWLNELIVAGKRASTPLELFGRRQHC